MSQPGAKITASNYNTLQSRVENILGNGSGSTGFGQTVNSYRVAIGDRIEAVHMQLLKQDINAIHVHTYGSNADLLDVAVGSTIGYDEVDEEIRKSFDAYKRLVDTLEADAGLIVDPTQVSFEVATTSIRYAQWNGSVEHVFTVTWTDEGQRRAFFNAGGAIVFEATVEGDNTPKGADWQTMLNGTGSIFFSKNATNLEAGQSPTPNKQVQPIGNYQVTNSYTEIFARNGSASYYAENRWYIFVRETADNAIQFKVRFEDNDEGDGPIPEDEVVRGTLSSIISQRRPTGTGVTLSSPSYSTQVNLSSGT